MSKEDGCFVDGCDGLFCARGLCNTHYARMRRTGSPLGTVKRRAFPETFWARIRRGPDCWEWTGAVNAKGYGVLGIRGRPWLAHRASWLLHKGAPGDLIVCHRCDNPKCVRPDHLFLGTPADNAADREAKGRGNQPRGERNGNAIVTEIQARAVRRMLASGRGNRSVSQELGVSIHVVNDISRGRTWGHLSTEATR